MREILFRGKRMTDGKWVRGSLLNGGDGDFYICPDGDSWYLIKPETVGQFTGFIDKNGKKIFEGDILFKPQQHVFTRFFNSENQLFVVKWSMDNGLWFFAAYDPSCPYGGGGSSTEALALEKVGNIHDNRDMRWLLST